MVSRRRRPRLAPAARRRRPKLQTLKWTEQDFAAARDGALPMGKAPDEWSYGDLDAGFKNAAVVVDETFVVQSTGHQPMETRSAMAYWQNGKLFLHGSTQSVARTVDPLANWLRHRTPPNIVLISEYCGGGFGSKGAGAVSMAIPALLSKKAGAPVMMRISREEEHYIGRARTGMVGRARAGFSKDGRITALDLFIVEDNGPYGPMGDYRSAAQRRVAHLAAAGHALARRRRGHQHAAAIAAAFAGPDAGERHHGAGRDQGGEEARASTSSRSGGSTRPKARRRTDRRDRTASAATSRARSSSRRSTAAPSSSSGTSARRDPASGRAPRCAAIGVAVGPHGAGSIGYDGLMTIRPDGRLYVQSGVGNLGTHSCIDLARVAADVLAMPWDKVVVNWGSTAKNMPWSAMSVGSQTTHAMTRANLAGAVDARLKLQEIAAKDLGGAPADYALGNERVYRRDNPSRGLTYAQAAERAIALGGKYDGHELPDDIHAMTKKSAAALAGLGLMGVAKDTYPRDGDTYSFVAGFAEVEVDLETGKHATGRLPGRWRRRHRRSTRAASTARFSAASTWASATRCSRSGSTTRSTACRSRSASTTTSR